MLPIILASSCASAPQKPSVELGVIDYPNNQVIVNMTGNPAFKSIRESFTAPSYKSVITAVIASRNRVPLASYDRAICFKPTYWQAVQDYMNSLVRYIQNNCGNR